MGLGDGLAENLERIRIDASANAEQACTSPSPERVTMSDSETRKRMLAEPMATRVRMPTRVVPALSKGPDGQTSPSGAAPDPCPSSIQSSANETKRTTASQGQIGSSFRTQLSATATAFTPIKASSGVSDLRSIESKALSTNAILPEPSLDLIPSPHCSMIPPVALSHSDNSYWQVRPAHSSLTPRLSIPVSDHGHRYSLRSFSTSGASALVQPNVSASQKRGVKGHPSDHAAQSDTAPFTAVAESANSKKKGKKSKSAKHENRHPTVASHLEIISGDPDFSDKQQSIQRRQHQSRDRPSKPSYVHMMPRPVPTSQYLKQANEQPVTLNIKRPLLVVLDLNGTLLYRKGRGGHTFVRRPGVSPFMEYLFGHHHVMVWSSARPENVEGMCRQLLPQDNNLVAVWARDRLRLTQAAYNERSQVYKQLSWIWSDPIIQATSKHRACDPWTQADTVLIDDNLEKAASEPFNLIQIEEFTKRPDQQNEQVLEQVTDYLEILRSQRNVAAYIRQSPFDYRPT